MSFIMKVLQQSGPGRFIKAIGVTSGPSIVAAAISFLSTPFFVIWFAPDDFGFLGSGLAIASILSSIVSLRFEIFLFQSVHDSSETAWLGAVVTVLLASVVALLAAPFLRLLGPGYGVSSLIMTYLLTLAICIGNMGTAQAIVEGRLLASGLPKVWAAAVTTLLAAGIHFSGAAVPRPLVIATLAGMLVSALVYAFDFSFMSLRRSIVAAWAIVRSNRRQVLFAAPQNSVAIAAFLNSAILIMGYFYGAATAGLVFLVFRLVGFPSTILSTAASNLLAADSGRGDDSSLRQRVVVMLVAGAAIYGPLMILGSWIPRSILPGEWAAALDFLLPIATLCFLQFSLGAFAQLLLVWDRAHLLLGWDVCRLIVTSLVVIAAASAGWSAQDAIWAFVAGQTPFYLVLIGIVLTAEQTRRDA